MPARIDEYLDKIIKRRFSVFYMSNAKWRKLFISLTPFKIKQAYWKFVDIDDEFRSTFVTDEYLMEKYVGDCSCGNGPFAYKRIEWVEIPTIGINPGYEKVPHMNFKQDIDGIVKTLNNIGQFEIEQTDRGVRINGYKE